MEYLLEATIVGFVLSLDSFSAALALGFRPHSLVDLLKFALISGGSEALVAFIGVHIGEQIISTYDLIDHWISFTLFTLVALHMIYEATALLKVKDANNRAQQFHPISKILIVSFATSLDAFAVGLGLGVAHKPLELFIPSIGLWAFLATILGMSIARKASERLGPFFILFGALILIILATTTLIEHLG